MQNIPRFLDQHMAVFHSFFFLSFFGIFDLSAYNFVFFCWACFCSLTYSSTMMAFLGFLSSCAPGLHTSTPSRSNSPDAIPPVGSCGPRMTAALQLGPCGFSPRRWPTHGQQWVRFFAVTQTFFGSNRISKHAIRFTLKNYTKLSGWYFFFLAVCVVRFFCLSLSRPTPSLSVRNFLIYQLNRNL